MKQLLGLIALGFAILSPFVYDSTGDSKCVVTYDTSSNGLWLLKERVCYGRLIGMENSRTIIARKPLFTEF